MQIWQARYNQPQILVKSFWNMGSGDFAQVKLLFHFTKLVVFYLWHRKFIITYLKCNPAAGPILHTNLFKEQLVFIWTLRNQNNSRKVPPWKTPTWKILIYQTPIWYIPSEYSHKENPHLEYIHPFHQFEGIMSGSVFHLTLCFVRSVRPPSLLDKKF